jgi:PPOX class probable F420-dependent enzyme
MSLRDRIRMDEAELASFLEEQRTVVCATNGRDGRPHLMPLWYVVRDGELWSWTYGASQKVRNLERDPRATLLIEAGEAYDELRGVMLTTDAVIERDTAAVEALGRELYARYADAVSDDVLESVAHQARRRVGIRFAQRARASWDHRKLAALT